MGCQCIKSSDHNNLDTTKNDREITKHKKAFTDDIKTKDFEVESLGQSLVKTNKEINNDNHHDDNPVDKVIESKIDNTNRKSLNKTETEKNIILEVIKVTNYIRQNPNIIAEKLIAAIENIKIKEDDNNNKKIMFKDRFILPAGEDLFMEVAEYLKNKPNAVALEHNDNLIMKLETEITIPNEIGEEEILNDKKSTKEQIDKIRYRLLREKNKREGFFKEHFIFSFVCGECIEDALIAQMLCNFRNQREKSQRPVDIIFNPDVNYIGVNLTKKKKKFEGFLIFAY